MTSDAMRITFLGTGTSMGVPVPGCDCRVCMSDDTRDRRLRPSVLLEWQGTGVLIDTATDLRQQALRYGIERVDAVLYTHGHADHILGVDDLRLYNWRQRSAIPAYGSAATLQAVERTFWYVFDREPSESTRPSLELRPVDKAFELHGKTVEPLPVWHGSLPIFAYRIGGFAYLTDVSHVPDESLARLEGLELLVLNALRDRPHPTHLTVDEAVDLAARIGARRTLLTHMSHEVHHRTVNDRLPNGVELAHDGLVVEVADGVDA